jgi:hypothetical protein
VPLPFVIPSELRISYYAAPINGHVCRLSLRKAARGLPTPLILTGNPEGAEGSAVFVDAETEPGGDSPTAPSMCPKVKLQVPPLRYPGFPVEFGGVGELHAAFLTESRTRDR